jgi:hypothetical protein
LSISTLLVRYHHERSNTPEENIMKRHVFAIAIAMLAAGALLAASPKSDDAAGPAAFARLKTLVGAWDADTSMGKVHLRYELISGGTALVEHESSDKMPEMLTVYYLDGGRLLLTHYCAMGNQPRLEARAFNPATGELDFRFLDATNLASPAAGHMHNATFRLGDHDHFSAQWEFYEDGRPKVTETAQYTRVQ